MLSTLKGKGFDCLATLVSIKMEHPQPLQVSTNVYIIYAQTGAGLIRVGNIGLELEPEPELEPKPE